MNGEFSPGFETFVREQFGAINNHLTKLNGRVGEVEKDIAKVEREQEKDRDFRLKAEAAVSLVKWAIGIFVAMGGIQLILIVSRT